MGMIEGRRRPGIGRIARVCIGAAVAVSTLLAGRAAGQTAGPVVVRVQLTGVVDPFIASQIEHSISEAASAGDAAVLLEIDTPGGLDSSMRQITKAILNAKIPVICYVAPQGARAASAGAFVLMSCPIAAMAPGTNVGAATPVGLAGAVESQKALNDAAAYMRSLAQGRNRNADIAETFVRDASSITAEDALQNNVIDLIAPNTDALLKSVSGRQVTLADGTAVTLQLAGASITDQGMSLVSSILHGMFDPSLAFLFFWLGLGLIVVELLFPGHLVSGLVGTTLLLISIVSFGLLPVSLIGIALLVMSIVFFGFEARHPGLGVWGVLGTVTLILGGLFLFNGTGSARVSPVVIGAVAILMFAFFGFVVAKARSLRNQPARTGAHLVVGKEGVALSGGLNPDGVVRVAGEQWRATLTSGSLDAGAPVRVTKLDGLVLTVEPAGTGATSQPQSSEEPLGERGNAI
jgi:membrane-bound serine protease (ClpP class)